MQLFFNAGLDHSDAHFTFDREESKHIVRVLRRKEGDMLNITNGKGYLFDARIVRADSKSCKVAIVDKKYRHPRMHSLHMAVAPTKNISRFEWFIEKATEIGINQITPLICERSERRNLKTERLEKVIQSALKQSLRTYLPVLNPAVEFYDFLQQDHKGLLYIAHCMEGERMDLKRKVIADNPVTILIGPEGDFTLEELLMAREKKFIPVSLGECRMRTETAAIVACTIVNLINNT